MSLYVDALQSMDQNGTSFNPKGSPIKDQGVNDLTTQLSSLTTTESDDDYLIKSNRLLESMGDSPFLCESNLAQEVQPSAVNPYRQFVDKFIQSHPKASVAAHSPSGLNSAVFSRNYAWIISKSYWRRKGYRL